MNKQLNETAKKVVAKTILAADESTKTITKRLATIGVVSNPEVNRQYRQILFTANEIEKYVSGVILYDETIRQKTDDGIPFTKLLSQEGVIPGIKVDMGTVKFSDDKPDTYTEGLEGLEKRLLEYKNLGAKFAKWRSVFTIAGGSPTDEAVEKNAQDLALYAKICQDAEIVPIVEPEVLMDGNHSIEKDKEVTERVLASVFNKLKAHNVDLSGVILKPNMVTSGKDNPQQADTETVAQTTLEVMKETVPPEVPGIAFLSGGQSPELATRHLNAINKIRNTDQNKYPWRITASFGRALQGEALEAWGGKNENVTVAQKVFIERAEKVFLASLGQL
ncbi:fructose-bisphosphate aldolase class I [Candidatus Roizmanbacteria bacterium]|nr:fructose-bisphosphate aldolase class I [Candidatus Roizmanbacteria bacterium]